MRKTRKQPTKPQIESLRTLHDGQYCGVAASSDWTNGQGRFTTRRATPVFSDRIEGHTPDDLKNAVEKQLRGEVRDAARRLLKLRPRIKCLVAITDLRSARKALKLTEAGKDMA